MREIAVGGAQIDAGPTVFTMRWVFEELFAAAGASFAERIDLAPARRSSRATPGAPTRAARLCSPTSKRNRRGDRRLRRRSARPTAIATSAARHARSTRRWRSPSSAARGPTRLASPRRVGASQASATCWRISPFATLWGALGEHFHDPRLRQLFGRYATYCGSSPFQAPATLMLVAHVEQDGVWLLEGGMHGSPRRSPSLRSERGATIRITAAASSGILVERGRVSGVRHSATASASRPTRSCSTATPRRLAPAGCGAEATRATGQARSSARSLSALTWAIVGAAAGFPLFASQRLLSATTTRAEFDAHFQAGACRASRPSMSARRIAATRDAPSAAGAAASVSSTRRRSASAANFLDAAEIDACEHATFQRCCERCGLKISDIPRRPCGRRPTNSRGCFRRPGERFTAGPRTAGGPRSRGRARGRACRGSIWRGAASHPGPGVPMAALSGRLAAASVMADLASTLPVRPGGYAWWYVDALSDDGQHGLTIIAFIGSVFSPYYAWARARAIR